MSVSDHALPEALRAKLFKTHLHGAIVRSVTSSAMWLFALFAFWVDDIQVSHFIGISCSVLFLVLINPPTLFILKRISRNNVYARFSLFINMLETVGYTGVIYSLGGFEATYMLLIYAGLITYLGAMAPRKVPFIIASFSAFCFGSVVILAGLGYIPNLKVDPHFNPTLSAQVIRSFVVIGLLFIVAYVSSFTAGKLKHGRYRLRLQNKELEEKTIQLEDSRHQLAMDNAQRKKAEEKYRFLAENMADIVWTLDKHLNATYLSPSIEKVLGFTAEQIMQRRLPEMITPESWQKVLELSGREFKRDVKPDADPARSLTLEVEYYKKDGTTVWMEDTVKAIRNTAGAIVGFYGVSHDIAARKEAERHALQTQKAESLGRMAGAIAHLFNNKFSVVQGNLELAILDLPDSADVRENLVQALDESRQAAEISGLMLSYLGHVSGKCEPLDLSSVFRQKLPLFKSTLPQNIVLITGAMTEGPVVRANAKQMMQILSQLIANAWEAIGDNAGEVTLATRTVTVGDIPKTYLSPADWEPTDELFACIEVQDTGCGIAEDAMDKIFDPFFTTKFTGRGLGLPVVLGFVKAWGGAMGVESRQDHGSVVCVYLPLAPDDAPRQSAEKATEALKLEEGETVLVVDDQGQVLRMAKKMLEFLGYTALTARSGSEALEQYRLNREVIRCVITDLSMPGMDGWQTLAALRALNPGLPVILSSGYDEAEVMSTESADQPHAFLHKPYSLREIKKVLQRS